MKASTLEGAAFCLILGLCVCADGLADTPGGMAALWGGVALSGALICLAHSLPRSGRKAAQRPAEGKRKAAAVVGTPQRQVKQTRKTSISCPYFTGMKGDCQI